MCYSCLESFKLRSVLTEVLIRACAGTFLVKKNDGTLELVCRVFSWYLKLETDGEFLISSSRAFHTVTDDGMRDLRDISVLKKGAAILF